MDLQEILISISVPGKPWEKNSHMGTLRFHGKLVSGYGGRLGHGWIESEEPIDHPKACRQYWKISGESCEVEGEGPRKSLNPIREHLREFACATLEPIWGHVWVCVGFKFGTRYNVQGCAKRPVAVL